MSSFSVVLMDMEYCSPLGRKQWIWEKAKRCRGCKEIFHVFSIFVMGICRSLWKFVARDDRNTENTIRQPRDFSRNCSHFLNLEKDFFSLFGLGWSWWKILQIPIPGLGHPQLLWESLWGLRVYSLIYRAFFEVVPPLAKNSVVVVINPFLSRFTFYFVFYCLFSLRLSPAPAMAGDPRAEPRALLVLIIELKSCCKKYMGIRLGRGGKGGNNWGNTWLD